jgi:hypothetical protein
MLEFRNRLFIASWHFLNLSIVIRMLKGSLEPSNKIHYMYTEVNPESVFLNFKPFNDERLKLLRPG